MILVFGASSYIGRHTLEAISSQGVLGTYRNNPVPGCVYFDATRMSLTDVTAGNRDFTHAVVLFAEPGIDACKADQRRSYEINVSSTKRLIDSLVQEGIKPIFTSSENVFDGHKGGYTEEDPPNPSTVYGSQKVEIERYLASHSDDYAVLRLAKTFGTNPEDGTILSSWLKQIRRGAEIRCARDQVFSPIHVDDVAAVIGETLRLNLSGVYHVSNTVAWSRLGMLNALLECLGTDARVVECSIRDFDLLEPRPFDLSMNPEKAIKATGLTFRTVRSCCEELLRRDGAAQDAQGQRAAYLAPMVDQDL